MAFLHREDPGEGTAPPPGARAGDLRHRPLTGWSQSLVRLGPTILFFVALSATPALAQIYVIEDADGRRRFTNEPVPGAELYLETRFSAGPEVGLSPSVPFSLEITAASRQAGVDPKLVEAIIAAESAFDSRALSHAGAQGLMQLMPATADRFNVTNVWDPRQNIEAGTQHLRDLMDTFDGDLRIALAAYNAGEGAVARYGGVPPYPETRQYVDKVLSYYRSSSGR